MSASQSSSSPPDIQRFELTNASKSFAGVQALSGVNIHLEAGEVHVLVGENGAGKSTLVKILSGIYRPDEGELRINGDRVVFTSPMDAISRGIVTIHQELMLVPELTVAENVFLGKEHVGRLAILDKHTMLRRTGEILAYLKQDFSPSAKVSSLGIAQQQMVEITRALVNNCKVLILDEPTAAITDKEIGILFDTIRSLKARGVAILYISHRLEELFLIGDRTTILRNGKVVYNGRTGDQSIADLIRHMIGREFGDEFPALPKAGSEVVLEVRDIDVPRKLRGVSCTLQRGEILGFYGLIGAGRTELMRTLFGLENRIGGTIRVFGKAWRPSSPRDAIAGGIGMIPEDRKRQGLLLERSVKENIGLSSADKFSRFGFLSKRRERDLVARFIRTLGIKTSRQDTKVINLSGGNQQKVVISRVLSTAPDIVIFDEPTRGIDVGAKQEVYRAMLDLLSRGKSILMVSSDIREVIGMSHRVIVMCEGQIAAELPRAEATQDRILHHSFPNAELALQAAV